MCTKGLTTESSLGPLLVEIFMDEIDYYLRKPVYKISY